VVDLLRAHRRLKPLEIAIYWKLLLRRALGGTGDPPFRASGVRSILFVCHGNIIRSPMMAALFKERFSGGKAGDCLVSSAGLHARTGRPADPRAVAVAREFGISLEDHRAQLLTDALVDRTELIVTMDLLNYAEIFGRYPQARDRILLPFVPADGGRRRTLEIADPFDGDEEDVRACFHLLHRSALCLCSSLASSGGEKS
jgi:protein-tyrosine phosphatase